MSALLPNLNNKISDIVSKFIPGEMQRAFIENFRFSENKNQEHENFMRALEECLKYLYLLSAYPEQENLFIPVCHQTDEVWHFLILQTRFYQDLCHALPGERFLHHKSLPFHLYTREEQNGYENEDKIRVFTEFLSWVPLYLRHFDGFTRKSSSHWKIVGLLMKEGMSLSAINQMKSLAYL